MRSTFIDSSIFIAYANARDRDHARSRELMDRVRKGEFGLPHTSDYVVDETITTAFVRTGRLRTAIKAGKIILGSPTEAILPLVRLLPVDERIFAKAWATFQTGRFAGLSFTDHTIVAQVEEFQIESVISLDTGFDRAVTRIA